MIVQPWVSHLENNMNEKLFEELKKSAEEFDDLQKDPESVEERKQMQNPDFLWNVPKDENE